MSASLVGSEMCIRDSVQPVRHSAVQPFMHAAIPSCVQYFMNAACHCAVPVSYTHLTLPTICSV
eukprot:1364726-Alexandrium_andersonii.AAC.1